MGGVIGRLVVAPFVAGASSSIGMSVGMTLDARFGVSAGITGVVIPVITRAGAIARFGANNASLIAHGGLGGVSFIAGAALLCSIVGNFTAEQRAQVLQACRTFYSSKQGVV